MNNIYLINNKFFNLVDEMILLNLANRAKFMLHYSRIDSYDFAVEFATVKCDIGRQVGKSEYISQRATSDDLIIVMSSPLIERYKYKGLNVFTAKDLLSKSSIDITYRNIYIDEPTYVFAIFPQSKIYNLLYKPTNTIFPPNQTFILLGI